MLQRELCQTLADPQWGAAVRIPSDRVKGLAPIT